MQLDDFETGPVCGDDFITEIIHLYPETQDFLESLGMHCLGCASAQFETLREACHIHRLNTVKVLTEVNRLINEGA